MKGDVTDAHVLGAIAAFAMVALLAITALAARETSSCRDSVRIADRYASFECDDGAVLSIQGNYAVCSCTHVEVK